LRPTIAATFGQEEVEQNKFVAMLRQLAAASINSPGTAV